MSRSVRITIGRPPPKKTALSAKRRQYGAAEKRQIVEESFDPRTSVARSSA